MYAPLLARATPEKDRERVFGSSKNDQDGVMAVKSQSAQLQMVEVNADG